MFLPTDRSEMKAIGWEELDVVLITGDAYIDHPSFGVAVIGKFLVKHGFRVGVIAQPDLSADRDFVKLPAPRLFFGITSGNVDSMVNNYTASKKKRKSDDYSEEGKGFNRPDRAVIVYTNRVKELFKGVPVVIGGIEASLRRLAHYDYWSDRVRRSILADSKADILVFGQGERTLLKIAQRIQQGIFPSRIRDIRGTAFFLTGYENPPEAFSYLRIESYEEVSKDKEKFFNSEKKIHSITNPYLSTGLIQETNGRMLAVNPPVLPDENLDEFYDLEFEKKPHPSYTKHIPAFEMIRNSITVHRGCFGGCTFCSISQHQGKFIQSRSENSIIAEALKLKSKTITDLGGPSANMYKMAGRNLDLCRKCARFSCLFPKICDNLDTSHKKILKLYDIVERVKRIFINSGIRHELALKDENYIKALAEQFTSGLLKIAPEHTETDILRLMGKPDISKFENFVKLFKKHSKKEQYVLPYLISAFPGSDLSIAEKMSAYLKKHHIKVEQVQDFIPLPMTIAACMFYTERDFFTNDKIHVAKTYAERQQHRKLMQWWKK